jgi:glycosyltransferase involved in cell wall biosynthesis
MPSCAGRGAVVYRWTGGMDAIDEYSRRLVRAMSDDGLEARYLSDGLACVDSVRPAWILLQYNPFRWGHSGFAPTLVRDAYRFKRRGGAPLAVMVHEAWIDMTGAKSTLIGLWQRAQLRALLRRADRVMTSTQALATELGHGAVHLPVAANVTPAQTTPGDARHRLALDGRLTIALFGRGHPSRALDYAQSAVAALATAHGAGRLVVLNLGAGAPAVAVPPGVEVHSPGSLPEEELSLRLWASDLVLLPFTDGVSTRRGTLMAALAHGRPVLGLHGASTDDILADSREALVLTPAGDSAAFARRAVELTGDPPRLLAIGEGGRRLYESRFDWPVLARSVRRVLAPLTDVRPVELARA